MNTADIIVVAISLLSAVANYFISYRSKMEEQKNDSIQKMASQIKAYWNLENAYVKKISELTNRNEKTIKIDFRDEIVRNGYDRPTMTAKNAEEILNKFKI